MESSDVKYCVTAFLDLLGFSNHLEVGNDLRTTIGQEVIKRLTFLEDGLEYFLKEKNKHPEYYPNDIKYKRINDAIIFTLDLPEFLCPRIGETTKEGVNGYELDDFITKKNLTPDDDIEKVYENEITQSILELSQFIGIVSRVHLFINNKENENYFPGIKTVISSGFRKSFVTPSEGEDPFSANFSFSNAYIAESYLKGPNLFIDNSILRLLGFNQYTKNIIKLSSFKHEHFDFNPFDDGLASIDLKSIYRKGSLTEVLLFRKKYLFREMNPIPIVYLQLFKAFLPYLTGKNELIKDNKNQFIFRDVIYKHFLREINTEKMLKGEEKNTLCVTIRISDDIEEVKNLILPTSV